MWTCAPMCQNEKRHLYFKYYFGIPTSMIFDDPIKLNDLFIGLQ